MAEGTAASTSSSAPDSSEPTICATPLAVFSAVKARVTSPPAPTKLFIRYGVDTPCIWKHSAYSAMLKYIQTKERGMPA